MKTAGTRGKYPRQVRKEKKKGITHFQTAGFGGFDETQVICWLWEMVKSMEAVEEGMEQLTDLRKQTRSRIRVEMRRYFARRKRRNVIFAICALFLMGCATGLFGFVIGIDRVSGNSMYPFLNHGDWIVYSRTGSGYQMDEVVVFERNGENYVKRIAGLPGDRVEISQSGRRVVVNGVQMRETYVTLTSPAGGVSDPVTGSGHGTDLGKNDPMSDPLTIMDGQYLVLGDNRSISIDSRNRDMGTVPEEDILGRVILMARIKR